MNDDKISVIIALYNNENNVKRCIESVIKQTYSNLEIVVVDDGSTDSSLRSCSPYKQDSRVIIIQKENGGLSSCRMRGLKNAHGKYVCFIDADDFLEHEYIEVLYSVISEKKADICVCGTNFISSSGELLDKETEAYSTIENDKVEKIDGIAVEKNLYGLFCKYYMCDSWNKMYRREFLIHSDISFDMPKGLNGSDMVFNHRLVFAFPTIATTNRRLYNHIIYSNSAVHRKKKNLLLSVEHITNHLMNDAKKRNIYNQAIYGIFVFYIASIRDVMQDISRENDNKELKEHIKKIIRDYKKFKKQNQLRVGNEQMVTKSLRLFCFLLELGNPTLLAVYLNIRKKML